MDDLFYKKKTEFDTEISEFVNRCWQNIMTPAKYDLGCTFVFIESRDTMGEKMYAKFVVFIPFQSQRMKTPPPYQKCSSCVYMRDLCIAVDEKVYFAIYAEMAKNQNIAVGKFSANGSLSFTDSGKAIMIHSRFSKSSIQSYLCSSVKEWYEKGKDNDKPEFKIEFTNPDYYYLPFPVKRLLFGVNLFDVESGNFLYFLK